MSSVSEIAKKLNKAWKQDVLTDGSVMPECKRIPLGSLGASYPLFGGLPRSAVTVYSGVEHSGKTLAAVQAMAQYQKEEPDSVCIYVDGEQALVSQLPFMRKMTGLNTESDHFLRYDTTGKSAEEIFSDIIELEQADNIGLIVIDSAPVLVSQADIENDFGKDNGQRASIAKSLGKFLKMMIMYLPKRNNALLVINQVREAGKTFTGATIYTEPCGYSLKYYPSMKIRFGTRKFTLGDKTDLPKGDEADGFRLSFAVTKNRLGPVNRGGGFITYRYDTGLDADGDMLEIALKYGFINRPNVQSYELINLDTGEVYTNIDTGEPCKFRGKAALIEYLNNHPEFKKDYIDMLDRNIASATAGKSLLDEDTLKGILDEEDSVEGNISEEEKAEKEELNE